jgi:DNA-directed RNA polymerase specialized sigma24 family protein
MAMTAKERWSLSEPAFDRLLRRFDPDPERGAVRYEEMRRKLAKFFEWRGCPPAEEHADEVLDRVARRLDEGLEILNVGSYCYGIARLMLRESATRAERQRVVLAELATTSRVPVSDDVEMTCLERCLERLDPDSRAQIVEYYERERRDRQEHRRQMAERLGIAPNALRIRLHRVRRMLEGCLLSCLRENGRIVETNTTDPPLPTGERDVHR